MVSCLFLFALAQVKSLASCRLGLVGVASVHSQSAMCAHRVVGGGACFCCLAPRVHRAPNVLMAWWGAGGLFGPCAERLHALMVGGNSLGACVPDSSSFSAALVLHCLEWAGCRCQALRVGGCSRAAGDRGGPERHIAGVVRVLMSGWQPSGPARPSRLGRCTSYRLHGMGVGTGGRLLVFVALAQKYMDPQTLGTAARTHILKILPLGSDRDVLKHRG